MTASPALHCFSERVFVHEARHGVHVAVRRVDGKRPPSWLADLSCLPAWLLVGHAARHEVERRCAGTPAMFQRCPLPDGLWLVRLGNARYLLGANPETTADWTRVPELAAAVPLALPAESAQFALGGPAALLVLRELCGRRLTCLCSLPIMKRCFSETVTPSFSVQPRPTVTRWAARLPRP
jgi:hypothetical protein